MTPTCAARGRPVPPAGGFSFTHDDGDFTKAVHRCVGVGKCRADNRAAGGFMCPSYLASKDEKDVTRGRARVLQELTNGTMIPDFTSTEVHESLDLCLSCKACASDCPAGVDMAQYKSEVLHRTYKGRRRPISHYTHRLAAPLDPDHRQGPARRARGDQPDSVRQAAVSADAQYRRHRPAAQRTDVRGDHLPPVVPEEQEDRPDNATQEPVVLWADSFTDGMNPQVARAAVTVLQDAGYRVIIPDEMACCGLTWITTGQLDGAKKRLTRLLDILGPYAAQGIPIVGLEPSCTAVLRSDLVDLLPDDPRSHARSPRRPAPWPSC